MQLDALPIGLAHNVKLKNPVKKDQVVRMSDVELVKDRDVIDIRLEQLRTMGNV